MTVSAFQLFVLIVAALVLLRLAFGALAAILVEVAAFAVVVIHQEDGLVILSEAVEHGGVLRNHVLELLVAPLDEVDHVEAGLVLSALLIVELEERLLVNALADDQKAEGVNDEVEEVAEVVLLGPVRALEVEDAGVDVEQDLYHLLDLPLLQNRLHQRLLVRRQDQHVNVGLREQVQGREADLVVRLGLLRLRRGLLQLLGEVLLLDVLDGGLDEEAELVLHAHLDHFARPILEGLGLLQHLEHDLVLLAVGDEPVELEDEAAVEDEEGVLHDLELLDGLLVGVVGVVDRGADLAGPSEAVPHDLVEVVPQKEGEHIRELALHHDVGCLPHRAHGVQGDHELLE
mmetsp:Transcript_16423/g.27831  ORF Transcript_16423/g.27831 Transcript_16423/m.27831 type:complete len:345 (-) Transcript_16423:1244-2278(-)